MEGQIILIDRPGEALEVDIIAADETSLTLAVPNTSVQFQLFRHSRRALYQGSLGGRSFRFVPNAVEAGKIAAKKRKLGIRRKSRRENIRQAQSIIYPERQRQGVTSGKDRVRESRMPGSVRAKANGRATRP
ncbi:MAG TPA: hypothetical protein VIG55_05255 [Methylosinus sp.]